MAAPKNNKYWIKRKKHGKDKNLKTPQQLWELACDYFQWCVDNPLQEEKGFAYQGYITKENFDKLRAFTWKGFELLLAEKAILCDINDYKKCKDGRYKDYAHIIRRIGNVIYEQKFTGAAADLLNPNLIARELGLRDNHDHTTDGEKIGGYSFIVKDQNLANKLNKLKEPR